MIWRFLFRCSTYGTYVCTRAVIAFPIRRSLPHRAYLPRWRSSGRTTPTAVLIVWKRQRKGAAAERRTAVVGVVVGAGVGVFRIPHHSVWDSREAPPWGDVIALVCQDPCGHPRRGAPAACPCTSGPGRWPAPTPKRPGTAPRPTRHNDGRALLPPVLQCHLGTGSEGSAVAPTGSSWYFVCCRYLSSRGKGVTFAVAPTEFRSG